MELQEFVVLNEDTGRAFLDDWQRRGVTHVLIVMGRLMLCKAQDSLEEFTAIDGYPYAGTGFENQFIRVHWVHGVLRDYVFRDPVRESMENVHFVEANFCWRALRQISSHMRISYPSSSTSPCSPVIIYNAAMETYMRITPIIPQLYDIFFSETDDDPRGNSPRMRCRIQYASFMGSSGTNRATNSVVNTIAVFGGVSAQKPRIVA